MARFGLRKLKDDIEEQLRRDFNRSPLAPYATDVARGVKKALWDTPQKLGKNIAREATAATLQKRNVRPRAVAKEAWQTGLALGGATNPAVTSKTLASMQGLKSLLRTPGSIVREYRKKPGVDAITRGTARAIKSSTGEIGEDIPKAALYSASSGLVGMHAPPGLNKFTETGLTGILNVVEDEITGRIGLTEKPTDESKAVAFGTPYAFEYGKDLLKKVGKLRPGFTIEEVEGDVKPEDTAYVRKDGKVIYNAPKGANADYEVFKKMDPGNPLRQELIKKYEGIDPRFTDTPAVESPKRGFIETIKESEQTTEPLRNILGEDITYKVLPNEKTLQRAGNMLKKDYMGTYNKVMDPSQDFSPELNASAMMLIRDFESKGDVDTAAEIAKQAARKATRAGQYIQTFTLWNRMTPEGMLRYAQKEVMDANESRNVLDKIFRRPPAELTPDQARALLTKMNEVQRLPEGAAKTRATREALEIINEAIPPSTNELFDAYRYQNMLSNPRTHMRNIYSNLWQAFITRPAVLGTRGMVDWVQATLTGSERQAYVKDVPAYYKALINSAPQGVEAFKMAMRGDAPIDKPDLRGMRSRVMPEGLTVVTRLMEASDRFLQTMVSGGEFAAQMSRGVDEEAARKEAERVAQNILFRDPTDAANKTGQGYVLSKIDQTTDWITQGRKKVPGLNWFIPFVRTPMNVFKQWIEYSPAGFSTIAGSKQKQEQFSKALVGSMATLIGAKLALDGKTTWSVPTDEKAKQLFYDTGRKPFSIRVGDKWVPLVYLGPFALAVALPAAMKHYHDADRRALKDSELETLTKGVLSSLEFFSQQTFLQGLGNFVRLAQGDSDRSLINNLAFTGGQMVPLQGLQRYIATIVDPVYRKARGFKESFQKDIPFLSKGLPYYPDVMGEPSKRDVSSYLAPWDVGVVGEREKKVEPYFQRELMRTQTGLLRSFPSQVKQIIRNPTYSPQEKRDRINKLKEQYDRLRGRVKK